MGLSCAFEGEKYDTPSKMGLAAVTALNVAKRSYEMYCLTQERCLVVWVQGRAARALALVF